MFGLKKLSVGGAGAASPTATPSGPEAEDAAAAGAATSEAIRATVDETMQLIEGDIGNAVGTMSAATGAVKSKVAEKLKLITGIRDDTNSLAERSEEATASATKLAAALDALAASSGEIGVQVQQSSEMAAAAETVADEASAGIEELKAALTRIEDVVRVISDVAKQTNLLALNATIEAARAGEAGRGFAVVANEVKGLSSETQQATAEIAGNIESLQVSAERSIRAVNGIIEQISRIRPVFSAVAAAVEEQVAATGELGESANTTSSFVREVAERADAIRTATDAAAEVGLEVDRETEAVMKLASGMNARLVMMMRQTEIGDRRRFDRLPVEIAGTAELAGRRSAILTVDLSEGGVLFKTRETGELPAAGEVRLSLEGIGTLCARIVARSGLGWHAAFLEHAGEAYEALIARLAAVRRENETFIERAREAAEEIGNRFAAALERREITLDRLFDTAYQALPDTDPQQWSVRALDFLEGVLPQIQEPLLAGDRRMAFCAAVDRNGYLPVHNRIYSQPQRPDDPAWNAANCRNRRIFDDRAGLSAARNLRPFLVQSYPRDMGNGTIVWMKEIDAPIVVAGRHWGGFRTAYRM